MSDDHSIAAPPHPERAARVEQPLVDGDGGDVELRTCVTGERSESLDRDRRDLSEEQSCRIIQLLRGDELGG